MPIAHIQIKSVRLAKVSQVSVVEYHYQNTVTIFINIQNSFSVESEKVLFIHSALSPFKLEIIHYNSPVICLAPHG